MIGQTISHYKILEKIGEGGMGVVYKAEDTKLERTVALKFLTPQALGSEEDKARFILEAKAAARLDHPNICTVYEIDETEDQTFIAMACVDGQSLEEKLEAGPLEVKEALDIALQVAEGLREAHAKGIIHRDIKAANIMVSADGQAKIMDFGLAKLVGRTRLTRTATIMGTVAYMSPEQASGDSAIDHRTDIWSLGVVFYKMLAGYPPFDAPSDAALIHKIIYEQMKPVSSLRSDVPSAVEDIIQKTLRKNPQERYQDMQSLIADLKSARTRMVAVETKTSPSIAVLPFVDMSPAKDQEYFCDGLAEELINALTQIKDLKVIARTSAFSFRGKEVDVRDIGRKLDVGTVLEGSVRKAGNRLRITAQLVDTTRGHHLWSEKYDRELEDVFAIQDEISEAIVGRLKPRLLREEKEKPARRQAVNTEAYNLYLRGRHFWNMMNEESLRKAVKFFECAIEIDPGYAPAHVGIADSYSFLQQVASLAPREVIPKVRETVKTSLELDDTLAEAHVSLGIFRMQFEWDWEGAEQEFLRAIELNPGYAHAHQGRAVCLMLVGQLSEALNSMKKALELDPFSLFINRDYALILLFAGHVDEAIEQFKKVIQRDPTFGLARGILAIAYLRKSMYEEAETEVEKLRSVSVELDSSTEYLAGMICALTGRIEEARQCLLTLEEHSERAFVPPYYLACLCFRLGDNDEGFRWLDKAYEDHDPFLNFLKLNQGDFPAGSDPRYLEMLKKIGLEP